MKTVALCAITTTIIAFMELFARHLAEGSRLAALDFLLVAFYIGALFALFHNYEVVRKK